MSIASYQRLVSAKPEMEGTKVSTRQSTLDVVTGKEIYI